MITHLDYLKAEKALLGTQTQLRSSGSEQYASYLIAACRLAQAECQYDEANNFIRSAAAHYSPDPPERELCLYCGTPTWTRFGKTTLCTSCRN